MKHVDFDYVGLDGLTIYRCCFEKFVRHLNILEANVPLNEIFLQKSREKWWTLKEEQTTTQRLEEVFFFLVEQGNKNGYNLDAILEIPDSIGQTCLIVASKCSKKILNYLIERDIKVNCISILMLIPDLQYHPDLTVTMMERGMNPLIIASTGRTRIDLHRESFENEDAKRLLANMPRSVHFSIRDIECEESCPAHCPSNFKRFYYKNGPLVEMTDKNRIGEGGFGMVFRQLFHGKPMAMKCCLVELVDPEEQWFHLSHGHKILDYHEKTISELRISIASAGSGVIVPVAFVRQQDQEKDFCGKWIANNYNIYIYPLYDCNLSEFHENYYFQFTNEILKDICKQCLTRRRSKR